MSECLNTEILKIFKKLKAKKITISDANANLDILINKIKHNSYLNGYFQGNKEAYISISEYSLKKMEEYIELISKDI